MTGSNITITHVVITSLGLCVLSPMPASAASPLSYDAVADSQDRESEEGLDAETEEDLDADEEDLDAVEEDEDDEDDEDDDDDGIPSSYRAKPDAMARESQSGGCSVNPRGGAPGMAVLTLLGLLGLRRRSRGGQAA